jgi:DNA invertase Pin-like site-specific DNA recombinase
VAIAATPASLIDAATSAAWSGQARQSGRSRRAFTPRQSRDDQASWFITLVTFVWPSSASDKLRASLPIRRSSPRRSASANAADHDRAVEDLKRVKSGGKCLYKCCDLRYCFCIMPPHHGKFVSYLRVSTKRQGESGLGLEAQRASVEAWLNGGRWQLVEEHVEVESGKRADNRPALDKALEACRAYNAKLLIAKLDRLSRDAHFLLGLEKAGVEFVAVDMPHANRLTVGIMALVAEQEREAISQRTKAALAAAKARGTRLGKPKGTKVPNAEIGCARSVETNKANAESFARRMRPVLTELNELSARSAAQELERRGYATARGGKWSATLVIRTRARLGAAP